MQTFIQIYVHVHAKIEKNKISVLIFHDNVDAVDHATGNYHNYLHTNATLELFIYPFHIRIMTGFVHIKTM